YYWLRKIRQAACEALPSLSGNNPIVPLSIPDAAVTMDSLERESSSDIVLRFGDVKLEIRNTASATLIENTLRALQHVR
ncbi:MAG TPA: IS66 family insertion sequence element accessory protein TnpB, partial [Candidatus Binatia bacterium]|nr:IS66 family insertion sequence element accessory protein TnpB [Candidatus Binatia bacterium]